MSVELKQSQFGIWYLAVDGKIIAWVHLDDEREMNPDIVHINIDTQMYSSGYEVVEVNNFLGRVYVRLVKKK